MGENEGWVQPSGIFPNGLLPNAAPAIRVLESERWLKAEERTAELIACIQPNQPSEERRNAVADYVQRLITKCFPCKVFTFGSVPLKTYLPDGDIDLTAVSDNQNLKETWAIEVRDMLENEEKDENAEFRVKEVQYIQAEVKIIKCLVENIVVDISFNQVGGLCTLCFLEEVDHLISQNHLFKRSIILIKAWCYYESRILGAHHGLISTYALETLVLYIFHVFNNCFAGPLEVLYRFLEFFSNFDWDNFCVSLWGPVHISSLPDVAAEPPRRDSGELLLSKLFLDACSSVYTVFPGGQENQGQPFVSKHFNVIDPLRVNNNLGRSVSKGNFYRIRSAFAFGAKKLARLLDCPKENLFLELNQFFMNTWDRHGSGVRPDAPTVDSRLLRSSPQGNPPGSDNSKVTKVYHNSSSRETKVEGTRTQSLKSYGNLNSQHVTGQILRQVSSNMVTGTDKNQEKLQSENLLNDIQGRFLFARTRSSPELTDTYGDVSSYERHNRAPYNVKAQATSAGSNNYNRHRRKNPGPGPGPEPSPSHSGRSTSDDLTSHQKVDRAAGSNSGSNTNHLESGPQVMNDGHSFAVGTQGMHQDEQDIVNMMASSTINGFKGQVHTPLNLAAGHLPFPISPSILASMGYSQRNFAGMIPTNFPLIDHSFSNMQFPHGLVPPQLSHYFSGVGGSTNSEGSIDTGNENVGTMEMNSEEADHEYWEERDMGSTGGFDSDAGNIEMLHADDKPQSTSVSFNYAPPSRVSRPGSSVRGQQKYSLEKRGTMLEDNLDNFRIHENQCNEVYSDERTTSSRFSSAARSSSIRSKTSSESSWEEPSTKVSKSTREKRGKNSITSEPSVIYGKGKTTSDHESVQPEKDEQDWNHPRNMSTDIAERNSRTLPVSSLNMVRHHLPSYESAQTSGSEPMIHMSPMVLGPGSQQRMMDNNGVVPFAFYLTGPPVPFLAMLPVYNVPPKAGTSDTSTSLYGGEEGIDNNDPGESFDSSEGHDQSGDSNNANSLRSASFEISDDHKSDILNSDFASHWQNLQYGRFCQNPRPHGPMDYPSPVMVPPIYLQGRAPWEGPGRPLSGNMNIFTQLMNYGPRLVPVSPIQSLPTRPPNVYQRYADDLPRYRTGTGTYLPNPKVPVRDRHPSGTRRGNYNYDRSDNNGEREGNWRSRNSGRNHNRNQAEKSSPRHDRLAASESRPDRSWNSYRQDSYPSYQSQNGPLRSNSSHGGPTDVAYGMYSVPAMDSGGLSSNGPTAPSVVMMYPYDHNPNYASHAEQLEFGSLGPVGFSGMNEQLHSSEGGRARGVYEEHRFQGSPVHQSSPDQPSSPHHHNRRV